MKVLRFRPAWSHDPGLAAVLNSASDSEPFNLHIRNPGVWGNSAAPSSELHLCVTATDFFYCLLKWVNFICTIGAVSTHFRATIQNIRQYLLVKTVKILSSHIEFTIYYIFFFQQTTNPPTFVQCLAGPQILCLHTLIPFTCTATKAVLWHKSLSFFYFMNICTFTYTYKYKHVCVYRHTVHMSIYRSE